MVEDIGVGLIEVVPHGLEVDALHLSVLIDGTAQRSLIDITLVGELGQRLSGQVILIDALAVVIHGPGVGLDHAAIKLG